MIRHRKLVPLPGGQRASSRSPRARSLRRLVIVAIVVGLLAAVTYLLTLAPDHYAASQAERLNGDTTVTVSGVARVVPGEGWIARPRVTDLVAWPPLPAVRDWRVLTGADTGVQLQSPDHGLRVELFADAAQASGESVTAWLGDAGGDVLEETLASGARLRHVDGEQTIHAVVQLGEQQMRVAAYAADGIDAYRPALQALLASVR